MRTAIREKNDRTDTAEAKDKAAAAKNRSHSNASNATTEGGNNRPEQSPWTQTPKAREAKTKAREAGAKKKSNESDHAAVLNHSLNKTMGGVKCKLVDLPADA